MFHNLKLPADIAFGSMGASIELPLTRAQIVRELALVDKIAQRIFESQASGTWARISESEREKWRATARKQLVEARNAQ